MLEKTATEQSLLEENAKLHQRLEEAQEELHAIRSGAVDALVIESESGLQVFVLQGLDAESNRLRGKILAQVSEAIIAVDEEQRVIYLNAAAEWQYGVTASEALGRRFAEICELRWRSPDEEAAVKAALREHGQWRGENTHVLRNGREIPVESSITVIRGAAGRPAGVISVVRDITDRKRTEELLRQADERKDNFIATLAHELRNPLAPIRNAVYMLRQKALTEQQLTWCREVIDRQVLQMVRLLDDLLDVSRITRNRLTLRVEPVDFAKMIEQAIEIARPVIDEAGHALTVTLPTEAVRLNGDFTRLAQIFSNILINAAKYTATKGQIVLTAFRDAREVVVTIKDTGIGIAADNLPSIFEIFGQVDSALERSQGGLGLGLSLVKGLVEMHGGRISAESEGLGKGSEFIVRLPVAGLASVPEPSAAKTDADSSALGKCRVLVVDDSHDNAESLALLLEAMGNDVRVAYDGEQALRIAETFRPKVALIDLGMPKVDGYETCRRIRKQPWGGKMVLIAQTGWGQEDDRQRAREAGFDYHLVKPVEPNAIANLLSAAVTNTAG